MWLENIASSDSGQWWMGFLYCLVSSRKQVSDFDKYFLEDNIKIKRVRHKKSDLSHFPHINSRNVGGRWALSCQISSF